MSIFHKIEQHYSQQLPFVVYRKAKEQIVSGFFQQSDEIVYSDDFTEEGFIFAPFDNQSKSVLIPKNQSEFIQEEIVLNIENAVEVEIETNFSSKQNHIKLVEKGVEAIHQNQFNKVVLSRKEIVELDNFNLIETYQKLLQNYPNAFVYVWFHPKVGLWLGATPETLVKIKGNKFETMALAGTQSYNGT
ncbi:MAG: chorismate-binding protein, partial [Flavobacteriaceae bacterium]